MVYFTRLNIGKKHSAAFPPKIEPLHVDGDCTEPECEYSMGSGPLSFITPLKELHLSEGVNTDDSFRHSAENASFLFLRL